MNYPLCYPPTPTLDLPDLTSGVWAAPCSVFLYVFTSIEAFDDLNLRFGSRPSLAAALSPLTLPISSQPILPVGTINLRRQTKFLPFSARCLHMQPRRQLFFSLAVPRSLHLLPGFLFLS
jgi:hypothetical protein